jgi:hypothetical protein
VADSLHSSIEGPEIAVFYRGEGVTVDGKATVTLPDYFEALTRPEGRTVHLTQIIEDDSEGFAFVAASRVTGGAFTVRSSVAVAKFYWEVKAVRDGIALLEVITDKPDEPTPLPAPAPEPQPKATQPVK